VSQQDAFCHRKSGETPGTTVVKVLSFQLPAIKIQGCVLYQLTAALSRGRWQSGERDAPGA